MKQLNIILLGIIISLFSMPTVCAQSVPQGMKYQAVARNLSGEVMANQAIAIKIALQGNGATTAVHYTEHHDVITNQFGLFSLVVGEGLVDLGDFNKVPWSSEDIWMEVAIKNEGESSFSIISSSKLLAVPYAFHAGTANALSGSVTNNKLGLTQKPNGVPSQNWSLFGNSKSDPEKDKLGTTDATDFVFITNNEERLRITADGEIKTKGGKFTIGGNLEVQGDSTRINKDLYVGRNVVLNFDETLAGETINYGNFTVKNMSATELTGTLDVFKETNLKSTLTVTEDGTFEDDLTVKDTLFAEKIVTKRFNIKDDVVDGEFLATFENTNNDKGDGIKIKLGKTATKNNPTAITADEAIKNALGEVSVTELTSIRNLLSGNASLAANALTKLSTPTPEEGVQQALAVAKSVCILGDELINQLITGINDGLGLPFSSREILVAVNGCDPFNADGSENTVCTEDDLPRNTSLIADSWIPGPTGGIHLIPRIEKFNFACNSIPGEVISLPKLALEDVYITNPLNEENVFVEFTDNTNWRMGAIKAQSIEDWAKGYLDIVYLYELYTTFRGLDKIRFISEFKLKGKEIAKDYLQIGVEYSSGNGDYAEWLERLDSNETISFGDIVAVKGGKITKDLTNAEQVMAVSHRPIVLGNIPAADKNYLGNNVAFMGQIPVKIMGAVATGDYIVGKGAIKGYGVAIHPKNMTVEDFKYAVGRSWDASTDSGPKLVNTVVGVHNGDFIHILKKMEGKFQQSETRLQTMEAKIDKLSGILSANAQTNL